MSRYYLDSGVLSWNGNGAFGKVQIQKFYENLPSSEHTLTTLDAQPVVGMIFIILEFINMLEESKISHGLEKT